MSDEAHFCWEQCCDRGPHACICGNDCEENSSPMSDVEALMYRTPAPTPAGVLSPWLPVEGEK